MESIAFLGTEFTFDGIPSEQYGIMIYSIDGLGQEDNSGLGTSVSIVEDRLSRRYRPIHYGTTMDEPLSFTLVFGSLTPLDRYDVNVIGSWLFGHAEYAWLTIAQPDLDDIRFRCILQDPEVASVANLPYAFSCTVICDSPFAYTYPYNYVCDSAGYSVSLYISNPSSYNGYYYPTINIYPNGGKIEIINRSDADRLFTIDSLVSGTTVTVDCLNQTIVSTGDENLYNYCNFNFPRLLRGDNMLEIKVDGSVDIVCEYPIAVGS